MAGTQKKFVLLTFIEDGVTACLNSKFVHQVRGEEASSDLSSVKEKEMVSAYWQADDQWFPAKVRKFGAEMMSASTKEKREWKKECVTDSVEDGQEEEEEEEEEEKE